MEALVFFFFPQRDKPRDGKHLFPFFFRSLVMNMVSIFPFPFFLLTENTRDG